MLFVCVVYIHVRVVCVWLCQDSVCIDVWCVCVCGVHVVYVCGYVKIVCACMCVVCVVWLSVWCVKIVCACMCVTYPYGTSSISIKRKHGLNK